MTKRYALTIPIGTPLREAERLLIEATLHDTGGNIAWAARILKIDRSTLHKKLNKYKRPHKSALSTVSSR